MVFTTSNIYIQIINQYKVLLCGSKRCVTAIDNIDNAGRNTPLVPWVLFSCFNINTSPSTWLLNFQRSNQGVEADTPVSNAVSHGKDHQFKGTITRP